MRQDILKEEKELKEILFPKGCLTVDELAKYLSCGRSKAYELANRPDFPAIRLGRKIVIPVDSLQAWIERQVAENAL